MRKPDVNYGYRIGVLDDKNCLLYGTTEDLKITKEMAQTRLFKNYKFENFLYIDCTKYEIEDNFKISPGKYTKISKQFAIPDSSIIVELYSELHIPTNIDLNTFESYFESRIQTLWNTYSSLKKLDIEKWKKVCAHFFIYENKYTYFKLTPSSVKRLYTLLNTFKENNNPNHKDISEKTTELHNLLLNIQSKIPNIVKDDNPWVLSDNKNIPAPIYYNMTLDGVFSQLPISLKIVVGKLPH
jgi:hypothetical protein